MLFLQSPTSQFDDNLRCAQPILLFESTADLIILTLSAQHNVLERQLNKFIFLTACSCSEVISTSEPFWFFCIERKLHDPSKCRPLFHIINKIRNQVGVERNQSFLHDHRVMVVGNE